MPRELVNAHAAKMLAFCIAGVVVLAVTVVIVLSHVSGDAGGVFSSASARLTLDSVTNQVAAAVRDMQNAQTSSAEKKTAAEKELVGAEISAQAGRDAETYAGADDTMAPDACVTMETEGNVVESQISADLWRKAQTASDVRTAVGVDSPGRSMRERLNAHNQTYCSDEDEAWGRCYVPGNGLQNADVQAGTVLAPNGGYTLSEEEYKAGRDFMHNVTNAVPSQNLPPVLERTAAGQSYLVEQRRHAARISLAQNAFNRILASQRVRN